MASLVQSHVAKRVRGGEARSRRWAHVTQDWLRLGRGGDKWFGGGQVAEQDPPGRGVPLAHWRQEATVF